MIVVGCYVVVYGGYDGKVYLDDIYVYDIGIFDLFDSII